MDLADYMGLPDPWRLELAAMLSQIGCAALPRDVLRKAYIGQPLAGTTPTNSPCTPRSPRTSSPTSPACGRWPRSWPYQEKRYDGGGLPPGGIKGGAIPQGARLLKAALDFDTWSGCSRPRGKSRNRPEGPGTHARSPGVVRPGRARRPGIHDQFPRRIRTGPSHPGPAQAGHAPGPGGSRPGQGEVVLSKGQELGTVAIRRLRAALGGKGDTRIRVLVAPRKDLEFAELLRCLTTAPSPLSRKTARHPPRRPPRHHRVYSTQTKGCDRLRLHQAQGQAALLRLRGGAPRRFAVGSGNSTSTSCPRARQEHHQGRTPGGLSSRARDLSRQGPPGHAPGGGERGQGRRPPGQGRNSSRPSSNTKNALRLDEEHIRGTFGLA
jgi:hypothetical protein